MQKGQPMTRVASGLPAALEKGGRVSCISFLSLAAPSTYLLVLVAALTCCHR